MIFFTLNTHLIKAISHIHNEERQTSIQERGINLSLIPLDVARKRIGFRGNSISGK